MTLLAIAVLLIESGTARSQTTRQVQHVAAKAARAAANDQLDPLLIGPGPGATPNHFEAIPVYANGKRATGWQDWSWAKRATVAGQGISVSFAAWSAIYLHARVPVQALEGSVLLSLNGGAAGGQQLSVVVVNGQGTYGKHVYLAKLLPGGNLPPNQWVTVSVPIQDSMPGGGAIGGIIIQEAAGKSQPDMLIGSVSLQVATMTNFDVGTVPISVQVDASKNVHPISPYIYGFAGTDGKTFVKLLRPTLIRWGGNTSTRFNWQIGHAWNAGSDYYFMNSNYGHKSGSVSDAAIASTHQIGAEEWLTIPTIGWVAKDTTSFSFPSAGGRASNAQGSTCLKPIVTADPSRTSIQVGPSFMQDWVRHLQSDPNLNVKFFSMDNEPELWGVTHYDVHPTCTGYDDIFREFTTYASAIKNVAPNSMVTGPATCCWYYYWNSMQGKADQARHGGQQFLPWFLNSVAQYDRQHSRRTLDVLDVHYYPDGLYTHASDSVTSAWRLQETRSLWDPTFVDHSWIAQPIDLIPHLQALIAQNYPGTHLGIGEWNFGAPESPGGGLAIADVLGIFGEQGLYMATYWQYPIMGGPGAYAVQMFRNYDGAGSAFGDTSVQGISSNRNRLAVYASRRGPDGHMVLMLINKMPTTEAVTSISVQGFTPSKAHVFTYDALGSKGIIDVGSMALGASFSIHAAPYSITLLDLAPAA